MNLPITNIEKFKQFNYKHRGYLDLGGNHLFEAFHVSSDDTVYHIITTNGNGSEGISLEWNNNPFNLDFNEDNFIRIVK